MSKVITSTQFYQNYQKFNHHKFERMVGLKKHQFSFLLDLFKEYVELNINGDWDKRGCKGNFTLEDKLLLTFRYLRDYPTFLVLGNEFGIVVARL